MQGALLTVHSWELSMVSSVHGKQSRLYFIGGGRSSDFLRFNRNCSGSPSPAPTKCANFWNFPIFKRDFNPQVWNESGKVLFWERWAVIMRLVLTPFSFERVVWLSDCMCTHQRTCFVSLVLDTLLCVQDDTQLSCIVCTLHNLLADLQNAKWKLTNDLEFPAGCLPISWLQRWGKRSAQVDIFEVKPDSTVVFAAIWTSCLTRSHRILLRSCMRTTRELPTPHLLWWGWFQRRRWTVRSSSWARSTRCRRRTHRGCSPRWSRRWTPPAPPLRKTKPNPYNWQSSGDISPKTIVEEAPGFIFCKQRNKTSTKKLNLNKDTAALSRA